MKILLSFVLSLVIISGIGFAYSENNIIPEWIKGVAGLWVEGNIADQEFIKALEFMIKSNIIHVDDSQRVKELEKENSDLKQKIITLESKNLSNSESIDATQLQETNMLEPYVITDKVIYHSGDTIHITGLRTNAPVDKTDIHDNEISSVDLMHSMSLIGVNNDNHFLLYHHTFDNNQCVLNENRDRTFSCDVVLSPDFKLLSGEYYIWIQDKVVGNFNFMESQPFSIR